MTESPHIRVTLIDEQQVLVDKGRIIEVATKTAMTEGACGEIHITLADPQRMASLNAQFLSQEGPTDVISFPIDGLVTQPAHDGPPIVVGEIVMSPQIAIAQAKGDPEQEIDLLVAHGVLHLLGFDHETDEQAEVMRERERAVTGQAGARSR
ncbi:MAG: rRNA maturation RNase YbeY [Actinomycetota bacterium]|nr:rRNA maturation RNase YbeY [Actinomycetota bacterium]